MYIHVFAKMLMFKHLCGMFARTKTMLPASQSNVNRQIKTNRDNEAERIIWMDLEMTGLDINKDHILEMACIITDSKLNIVAEGPELIINQPIKILNAMDEWCIEQHGKTGLIDESKNSTITINEASNIMLDFFHLHLQPGVSPLAGSSVYMDKLFLMKHLPKLAEYMHYRIIDVSSIKELCRRWNPNIYSKAPQKQFLHRSLSDIKESINELKWYRENFLKILN